VFLAAFLLVFLVLALFPQRPAYRVARYLQQSADFSLGDALTMEFEQGLLFLVG